MTEDGSGFEQLIWDDVTSSTGAKILTRGKSYKRQSDLCHTNDRLILAWVRETKPYVTLVTRESSGTLSAVCSCPYHWTPRKHRVALALAYPDSGRFPLQTHIGPDPRDKGRTRIDCHCAATQGKGFCNAHRSSNRFEKWLWNSNKRIRPSLGAKCAQSSSILYVTVLLPVQPLIATSRETMGLDPKHQKVVHSVKNVEQIMT